VQSALKLLDELRRTSQELKDVALELRDHDRRITRLEAQGGLPSCCLGNAWNENPALNFSNAPDVSFIANRLKCPSSIEAQGVKAMKNTQAWGWLAAGVLALGLNGIYHDGGSEWAHRALAGAIARIEQRTGPILALAAGRADLFIAKTGSETAKVETNSCRLATAMARVQTQMARTHVKFARFEQMSAGEEAALARMEADRARIEAQVARVRFEPAAFETGNVSSICPRVRVPRVSIPRMPVLNIPAPEFRLDGLGRGPV
jgi:hypothetical protein